jgi:hypothetical protein
VLAMMRAVRRVGGGIIRLQHVALLKRDVIVLSHQTPAGPLMFAALSLGLCSCSQRELARESLSFFVSEVRDPGKRPV